MPFYFVPIQPTRKTLFISKVPNTCLYDHKDCTL